MNLYGFAGGDPVTYSDPFGLCPEEQRDKDGKCPGGLEVAEWEALDGAAGELETEDAAALRDMMNRGVITGGWLPRGTGGFANPVTRRITLNRSARGGSMFNLPTVDLAFLVSHEIGHLLQYQALGTTKSTIVGVFDLVRHLGRTDWLDVGADVYACRAVRNSQRIEGCR